MKRTIFILTVILSVAVPFNRIDNLIGYFGTKALNSGDVPEELRPTDSFTRDNRTVFINPYIKSKLKEI